MCVLFPDWPAMPITPMLGRANVVCTPNGSRSLHPGRTEGNSGCHSDGISALLIGAMAFTRCNVLHSMVVLFVVGARLDTTVHGQNACARYYYAQRSTSNLQRYTISCGILGWSRCSRYRYYTTYYSALVTAYDICCAGWRKDSSNRCTIAICSQSCLNGGRCVSPNVCQCSSGYTGSTCSQAICSPYCVNGGACVRPNVCQCPSGYTGSTCSQAICSPSCVNGGACVRPNVCQCPSGYTGSTCSQAICAQSCENGGACVRPNVCQCSDGYTGSTCSQAVCEPSCVNGTVCVSPDVCRCPDGYTGTNCSQAICAPSCANGGVCVSPDVCQCPNGYAGRICAQAITAWHFSSGDRCDRSQVIETILSRSRIRCGAACMRDSRCKSFNYYKADQRCELMNGANSTAGGPGNPDDCWHHTEL